MHHPKSLSISQQMALKKQNTPQIPAFPQPQNVATPNSPHQGVECALGKHAINTHFFDGQLPSFTSSINDKHVAQRDKR